MYVVCVCACVCACVYIPMSPPGTAYCSSFCSAKRDTIRDKMGRHWIFPSAVFETIPGRTSISWPTYIQELGRGRACDGERERERREREERERERERDPSHTLSTPLSMLPPATPPFRSSTSDPGLFTSKDRITMDEGNTPPFQSLYTHSISSEVRGQGDAPINLGSDVKSLIGTGIFLEMYSQMTSMLYLS